jgi:hypothetical protein
MDTDGEKNEDECGRLGKLGWYRELSKVRHLLSSGIRCAVALSVV